MANDKSTAENAMNTDTFVTTTDIARAIARSEGKDYNKLPEKIRGDYTNRAHNAANNVKGVETKGRSQFRKGKR